MASKAKILAAAKKAGVNVTRLGANAAELAGFIACVTYRLLTLSLPKAVKKCAREMGYL